jgi:prolipoprotein diacylglyceryl transferase
VLGAGRPRRQPGSSGAAWATPSSVTPVTSLARVLAYIPSPSSGALHIGPLQLRAYGLCIALGVWAAVALCARRFRARGGDPALITVIAVWAVPAGIIGARIYHVITDYELYFSKGGHPLNALKIWDGGLGIWGGIAAGVLVGVWVGHRHHASAGLLMDCAAPALPLAQAIGRWGNWWNQELFGRPTKLPWALKISPSHRPLQYARYSTFHPTFLYESLWDLCVVGIVLLVERRFALRRGSLLAVYAAAYTFGRFFTEYERVDFAHKIGPLRLNDWTSVIVFVASLTVLVVMNRGGRRTPDTVDGDPPTAIPPADLDRDPTDPTDSARVADTADIGDISDGEPADAG